METAPQALDPRNPRTIASIQAANSAAGFHFFDPPAMRFFRSRVLSGVAEGPGGVFFVTSERFVPSSGPSRDFPRRYTVRRALASGAIADGSEFQGFATAAAARRAARKLAAGEGGAR